jgi:hypothetical protein
VILLLLLLLLTMTMTMTMMLPTTIAGQQLVLGRGR